MATPSFQPLWPPEVLLSLPPGACWHWLPHSLLPGACYGVLLIYSYLYLICLPLFALWHLKFSPDNYYSLPLFVAVRTAWQYSRSSHNPPYLPHHFLYTVFPSLVFNINLYLVTYALLYLLLVSRYPRQYIPFRALPLTSGQGRDTLNHLRACEQAD